MPARCLRRSTTRRAWCELLPALCMASMCLCPCITPPKQISGAGTAASENCSAMVKALGSFLSDTPQDAVLATVQVRFLEDPQQFRGAGTLARIDAQISRATALADRIASLDHEVIAAQRQSIWTISSHVCSDNLGLARRFMPSDPLLPPHCALHSRGISLFVLCTGCTGK